MKLLFDFFPVLLFFIVYKATGDIIIATGALIPATIAQVVYTWFKRKKVETIHIVTLVAVVVLGGATILFKDDTFIKWKPTVVFWLLATVFFISSFIGEKNLYQRMLEKMMDDKIAMPAARWRNLNLAWVIFNASLGCLNLYVAYEYTLDQWINFKLFGILGLSFTFAIGQTLYLAKYLPKTEDSETETLGTKEDNKL